MNTGNDLSVSAEAGTGVCVKDIPRDYEILLFEHGFVKKKTGVYIKMLVGSKISLFFGYNWVSGKQYTDEVPGMFEPMIFELFGGMTVDSIDELKHVLKHPRIRE
jgi:hypothetical protein